MNTAVIELRTDALMPGQVEDMLSGLDVLSSRIKELLLKEQNLNIEYKIKRSGDCFTVEYKLVGAVVKSSMEKQYLDYYRRLATKIEQAMLARNNVSIASKVYPK
jgi:hypothetical protein